MNWEDVLDNIKKKISKPSFATWLADTTAEIDDDVIFVKAKNEFQADWLESRYKTLIFESIREVAGHTMEIEIISPDKQNRLDLPSSEYSSKPSAYVELKNLIEEQQKKINELEHKNESLEQRIVLLEQKISDQSL